MGSLSNCPACGTSKPKFYAKLSSQMHHTKEIFSFDRCDVCQLLMLNPRPAMDVLRSYYSDHYLPYRGASAWGRFSWFVNVDQTLLDKRRVQILEQHGKLSQNSVVLDVGCGKPTFLKSIYRRHKSKCIGIDFSDYGWSGQSRLFPKLDLRLKAPADLELDYPPDFITMWHYLEHDYFPHKTLKHLAKLSGPDTHLIIEVPNFDSESRKKYSKHWAGWHTPRHTFLFSPNNISLLLAKCGWEVIRLELSGTMNNYLLYWMSEMERKQIDWSNNMEKQLWGYMTGQFNFFLQNMFKNRTSHGIMLLVATPKKQEKN